MYFSYLNTPHSYNETDLLSALFVDSELNFSVRALTELLNYVEPEKML